MPTKKHQVREHLAKRSAGGVSETEWFDLLRRFAPISESYLRKILHDSGLEIEQPFDGVRSSGFDLLEASLIAMERAYRRARDAGDEERARLCRRAVIQAKDRARIHARTRKDKAEMVTWMLVWLDDPGMFETWVKLRRRRLHGP